MRKILIISISTILVISLAYFLNNSSQTKSLKAGSEHNVSGWAWAENIGWISFNCNSLVDTNNDGIVDQPLKVCDDGSNKNKLCNPGNPERVDCLGANCRDACEVVNYGVNIDSSGNLSGYAWSENIGWIDFNPPGPYPTNPNYSAKVDLNTKELSGWARALAGGTPEAGDWDGWIKLRGWTTEAVPTEYGVSLNPDSREFEGWAAGWDDSTSTAVVGWISFNCSNRGVCTSEGGPSDYKVMTSILLNQPPAAPTDLHVTWNHCAFKGISIPTFNWSTFSDPDGDEQESYEVKWNGTTKSGKTGSACALTSEEAKNLEWGKTYNWQVRVKDNHDNWSDWSAISTFEMPLHAYPWVDFIWTPETPSAGDIVQFYGTSTVYGEGTTISSWDWTFPDGSPSTSDIPNPTTTFIYAGPKTVKLTVTDSDNLSCPKQKTINIQMPSGEWQEVAP
jgi:hypothetical protein